MPITTNGSYLTVIDEVLAHWNAANNKLPPAAPLIVRLPELNAAVTRANLVTLRGTLETQQLAVQPFRADYSIARGAVNLLKTTLLGQFNDFVKLFDAYYPNTPYYALRPYAPVFTAGKDAFCDPMGEAMVLWSKLNTGVAPAGMNLPLVLGDATTQGTFASNISALAFAFKDEKPKLFDLRYARSERNDTQTHAYEILVNYREAATGRLTEFPALLDTLPRITPLPGHTPNAVNASAVFEAPDKAKVIYDASTEATLQSYQLRGNAGDEYSDEDAIVLATNGPGAPREFNTTLGLNQPGARVALKVYVILTTGNEAGSAPIIVQRPFSAAA